MEKLDAWIKSSVKPFLKLSGEQEDYHYFLRDEMRPIICDENAFYSCADGVVVYNKILRSGNQKIDTKGVEYSVNDVLGKEGLLDGPFLICGVFMTFADIHLNRAPYSSIINYEMLDPIESFNISMDATEERIFGDLKIRKFEKSRENQYLKNNARMLNRFYIPSLDYSYYIVQIADYEVNVIQHFTTKQKSMFHQGERFSFVRWGSQCDLIMPLRKDIKIKPLIPEMVHVKAGIDKVASFVVK